MYDIYVITNKENNKKYVGCTSTGYKERFARHIKEARLGSVRPLCVGIREHGADKFVVALLERAESEWLAYEREKHYIKLFNTCIFFEGSHGYNGTAGGKGMNGVEFSDETKTKIADKASGRWTGENNPNFKAVLVSGEDHPMYGKRHSEESKRMMSDANKGRFTGNKNPAVKNVVCYSVDRKTGEVRRFETFFSLIETLNDEGVKLNRSSVLAVMRGDYGRVTYKGFKFYRADVTPPDLFREIERKYQSGSFS